MRINQEIEEKLNEIKNEDGWEIMQNKNEIDYFWHPTQEDEGKTFRGLFLQVRTFKNKYDEEFESLIILTEKNEVVGIRMSKALEVLKELEKHDGVFLKYIGLEQLKGGRSYHNYMIRVKKFGEKAVNTEKMEDIEEIYAILQERIAYNLVDMTPENLVEEAKNMKSRNEINETELSCLLKYIAELSRKNKKGGEPNYG